MDRDFEFPFPFVIFVAGNHQKMPSNRSKLLVTFTVI